MLRIVLLNSATAGLALLLIGCSDDTDDLFVAYVHPDRSIVSELKDGKVDCMHCPRFFRFEIARDRLELLLVNHGLVEVATINEQFEEIVELPEAEWWPKQHEITAMRKFWVELPNVYPEEAPPFRLALVDGETVYCIATQRAPMLPQRSNDGQ